MGAENEGTFSRGGSICFTTLLSNFNFNFLLIYALFFGFSFPFCCMYFPTIIVGSSEYWFMFFVQGTADILQKYPVPECDIWFIKFSCDFHYNAAAIGNMKC